MMLNKINFTFGIITDGTSDNNLLLVIESIIRQSIENFEIIIVGNTKINLHNIVVIPFSEELKSKWITRKKNIIINKAKFENIVFLHDYVILDTNWYKGFLTFGNGFDVCMNIFLNKDGSRFRDWTIWPHNNLILDKIVKKNRQCLLPYHISHLTKYMYVSGTYWVAKTNFMKKYPLNEDLVWGESEDVEWSLRIRDFCNYKMNQNSTVLSLKQKDVIFTEPNQRNLDYIISFYPDNNQSFLNRGIKILKFYLIK